MAFLPLQIVHSSKKVGRAQDFCGDPRRCTSRRLGASIGREILKRTVALGFRAHERGKFFTMENPLDSYAWEIKTVQQLMKVMNARLLELDQCPYGAETRKPTGIFSAAPWMDRVTLKCMDVRPHRHREGGLTGHWPCVGSHLRGLDMANLKSCRIPSRPLLGMGRSTLLRLGQATMRTGEGRSQCYVDDPILIALGRNSHNRSRVFARVTLLWCALGARLAWKKVSRGCDVEWIGVALAIEWSPSCTLRVSLTPDKTSKLFELFEAIIEEGRKGMIPSARWPRRRA